MKRKVAFILFSLFLAFGLYGNVTNIDPPIPFGPPHPELSIDGGIGLLIFAGVCYGAYKSRQNPF